MEKIAKRLTRKAWRALRTENTPDMQATRAAEVNRMIIQKLAPQSRVLQSATMAFRPFAQHLRVVG